MENPMRLVVDLDLSLRVDGCTVQQEADVGWVNVSEVIGKLRSERRREMVPVAPLKNHDLSTSAGGAMVTVAVEACEDRR